MSGGLNRQEGTVDASATHVLAAGFESRADAEDAERELRATLDLEDADLRLAHLGGDAGDGFAAVVGGRFHSYRVKFVRDVFEHHGGVILTDVPGKWVGAT